MASLFSFAVSLAAVPHPVEAQDLETLVEQNRALVEQNRNLMRQNDKLMEMIEKNARRIRKLESALSSGSGNARTAEAPAGPAAPARPRSSQRRGPVAASGRGGARQREEAAVTSGSQNVRLSISGQINRSLLVMNDGENTDIFHVDNDNSSTRFRFVGEADIGRLTAGTVLEMELESNSTANINQLNESDNPSLNERKIEVFVRHPTYGRLSMGQGDTASNNTAEVDLSGTAIAGYSGVGDTAGGILFFDNRSGVLSTTQISGVTSNFDGLSRDDRVRYDTPKFHGFNLATSYASSDKWDVALFHAGKYGAFNIAGAAAYSEPKGGRHDRIDGSVSVLHESGVNLTLAAGRDDLKAGGRDDPWSVYGKIGYIVDWRKHGIPWMARVGNTALALDYQRTADQAQNGDTFRSIGGFVVQKVDDWAADLYLGLRWHDLERDNADFDDVIASVVGGRFKF